MRHGAAPEWESPSNWREPTRNKALVGGQAFTTLSLI